MKSFIELAEDIFCSTLLLSNESAEEIKKDFTEKVKEFCNDCSNNGYAAGEIENAKYALCAWVDEYIYANCGISSQWFSHSLVLGEFGDAEAGKHFFERMENFHRNKNHVPLLELYAKCILFGFMGKFRMGETAELKQILNNAISKTDTLLEPLNYKPAAKSKHKFSFRRGVKNIAITGQSETQCRDFAKKQKPPKGYKYIYSDMKNIDELPFIDGIISINQNGIEKKSKAPIYTVADLEIPEWTQTLDRNYEFSSSHLNCYLHKHFLDNAACKNILSLPKKLEQFKNGENFYTLPFFPFMENEKPLAYSLAKRAFSISFLICIAFLALSFVFSIVNEQKEKIKNDDLKFTQDSLRSVKDSLQFVKDSLDAEFERYAQNLELGYRKQVLANFPFAEGKTPRVSEVLNYFDKDGEFYKFMEIIDTISDARITFNKKTLAQLSLLKNNMWSEIPVSIIITAPKIASLKFGVDSEYVEVEQGKSKSLEVVFPKINGNGIELTAITANSVFNESVKGEWSLLRTPHEFSFKDKSYLIDVFLFIDWHLPKNAIKPKKWFELRLEPNLIENFPLTTNLGE
ncbi:MAG: DotU family type IV/VI secretion system protein [Fibromonadales bacterium]|nr:DotU family type IV/VI secretion system protein [Fibromonadales bacterium]